MKSKFLTSFISSLLLLAILFGCTACGSKDPNENTENTTDAVTEDKVQTTKAPETTKAPDTTKTPETINLPELEILPNGVVIYDPAALPFKYTQTDVCAEPSLNDFTKFADNSKTTFIVPGLNEGFIQQGMDYWEERGWMLISCYNSNSSLNSVLFAVDIETGKFMGEYYLRNMNGDAYKGHAGGVAVTKKNVFISDGKKLYRIPLSDLDAAKQCGSICFRESISVPVNASFCNYSGGILWVGDFHLESAGYTTASYRHMINRFGEQFKAWTVGYILDETTENEFKTSALVSGSYATPDYIFSISDRVQGMTYVPEKGRIVLSTSYGRKNQSGIYSYKDPRSDAAHTTAKLNGVDVPVWFLDGKEQSRQFYLSLPMSEGIANVNGKVYILFESGAKKYRLDGGKLPTDMVYALDITK